MTWNFGSRLYDAFFASYTEKVWGIPGSEIRAEWAAQRIKDFSFGKARPARAPPQPVDADDADRGVPLPAARAGPDVGARCRHASRSAACPSTCGTRVQRDPPRPHAATAVTVEHEGRVEDVAVDGVLSSLALSELVLMLDPAPPEAIVAAAERLRYRSLCLVALVIDDEQPFPDNWIYLHDPGTRAGRVQNFGAWSEAMVRPGTTCLGVEYFCFEDDDIWLISDEDAVALATEELARIGLVDPATVVDGVKVRVPKAYPMYDANYREAVAVLRGYLEAFENLETFGRNGLHRYNNQDHSMWTAILATLNLVDGTEHDVWSVNTEAEYHEEGDAIDALLDVDLVD